MTDAVVSVRAHAIAATLTPKELKDLFPPAVELVRVGKTRVVARYGPARWAAAYDFGAVVLFGLDDAERDAVVAALTAREPDEVLVESFSIELRAGADPEVHFDRVVAPALDERMIEVVSLVIAQSVAMEYYEADVDAIIGSIKSLSADLADRGRFRARDRELLSFIGRGMAMRTRVVHTLALLDAPALTWDSETLDRLYRALRASFEIEDRYRALDHKLGMIQDNLELLVDLSRRARSFALEVLVVVLIATELVLGLVRH